MLKIEAQRGELAQSHRDSRQGSPESICLMLPAPDPSVVGSKACATWTAVSQTPWSCEYSAVSWSLAMGQHGGNTHCKEVTNWQRLELVSGTCSVI